MIVMGSDIWTLLLQETSQEGGDGQEDLLAHFSVNRKVP